MIKIKVLAINGSPRGHKSNTDRILQPFLEGARTTGAECETVYAKDLSIKECSGCYSCWKSTPGICIYNDDMPHLLEKIKEADVLVWATPLYHFGMNVRIRRIIERTLPLNKPYMVFNGKQFTHPPRYDKMPSKTILIANCGFPDRCNFDAILNTFEKLAGGKGLTEKILCAGGELLGVKELEENLAWYGKAAYEAGREIIELGKITEKTSETLKTQLMPVKAFVEIANASWNVQGEKPPTKEEAFKDFDAYQELIKPDKLASPADHTTEMADIKASSHFYAATQQPESHKMQIESEVENVIREMSKKFNPANAVGMNAIYQFCITGLEKDKYYHLRIADGKCTFNKSSAQNPSITISTPGDVWIGISKGEIDGTSAMMEGRYSFSGDLNLLMRMNTVFGGNGMKNSQEKKTVEGPIKIKGLQWLTVAFIPWIYFWIFSGKHDLTSFVVPLGISLAILLYRTKYIEVTFMDIGGFIFFALATSMYFIAPNLIFKYGVPFSSLAQALIWTASLATDIPLTASYSKYSYPSGYEKNALFIKINSIITAFWVVVYIIQAIILISIPQAGMYRTMWIIANYALLIPAFIFTNKFPNLYISRRGNKPA